MLFRMLLLAASAAALTMSPRAAISQSRARVCMAAGIRTGDNVYVLSGDDKGSTGKVISIDVKKKSVTVEGINMRTKHVKPVKEGETGSILKRETSIHISNVRLADDDDASKAADEAPPAEQ
uniref:KOW domain-containing protein n=1 Tax=Coccolithus braarudii TaxID=221442 RepID=A0A7S0L376_9EUKA|mmetsp:Transcript_17678/g.38125  ORF Transcript_17678/g.38125 Transcript_17678/m.38125 type:complete len:122 (+) Transcript_17678:45-410(+)